MATPAGPPEIDFSFQGWVQNITSVLAQPFNLMFVITLLVVGTFAEVAPRENLLFLDNVVGKGLLFAVPLLVGTYVDWPTGLLAAVVGLILLIRIQKPDMEEGFITESEYTNGMTTKLVSTANRWFVERVLGERPVAISDDRVITRAVSDQDTRTSSSSSMTNSGPSDSSN